MSSSTSVARVGDLLPDFTLPLIDAGDLNFRDLRPKRLLLFFWGSW